MSDIIANKRVTVVIGGGASGLMSALQSALKGNEVYLVEKNEKLGKKIYITGKGRCNLTNNCSVEEFLSFVVRNSSFMRGSLYSLSPEKTMQFFKENGTQIKTERGNRVFPLSDKASDVTFTFEKLLKKLGVKILLNTLVEDILTKENRVIGVQTINSVINCDSVIIATGGISYSSTGSTGDGYKFAKNLGHNVIELKPSLVGLNILDKDCKTLQGLTLKNVVLSVNCDKKNIFSQMGELLFTHFGISGPLVLSCSSYINRLDINSLTISIDLKPALSFDVLEKRLIREFQENNKKSISYIIKGLLPSSMVEMFLNRLNISKNKTCSEITKLERTSIITLLKNFTLKISSLRPIEEAVVTSGGVDVKQINPKTMESKIIKNLFFAGEIIDVDCLTGGFNLQVAFSTGYVAGKNS